MSKVTGLSPLLLFIFMGCTQSAINEVDILNETSRTLENVELRIPATGGIISCNIILPRTACAVGFPERTNNGNTAILSWRDRGQVFESNLDAVERNTSTNRVVKIAIISILESGRVTIELR